VPGNGRQVFKVGGAMARNTSEGNGRRQQRRRVPQAAGTTPRKATAEAGTTTATAESHPTTGTRSVTVTVPEEGRLLIQKAAQLMREGVDPSAAMRRAGGGFDLTDPPPSRNDALYDNELARQRDQQQMATLRNRLETQELRSNAELGQKLRELKGWRLMLARLAGLGN